MNYDHMLNIVDTMYAEGFDEISTQDEFLEVLQELMRKVAEVDANATVSDVLKILHGLDD